MLYNTYILVEYSVMNNIVLFSSLCVIFLASAEQMQGGGEGHRERELWSGEGRVMGLEVRDRKKKV